jgi:lysophospholipase L1-like esterase
MGIRVALCTTTVITEDGAHKGNRLLETYNQAIRQAAARHDCLLIEINGVFWKVLSDGRNRPLFGGRILTSDGIHLNKKGNRLMAETILAAFGFTPS